MKWNFKLKNWVGKSGLIALLSILTLDSMSQIPTACGTPNCTSNDVRITKATLSSSETNPNAFPICVGSETYSGDLYLHLIVSTNTKRVGVFVSTTLEIQTIGGTVTTSIQKCFTGRQLTGTDNDLAIKLEGVTFQCGGLASLVSPFTAWGTGGTDFCGGSSGVVCQGTPSKCRYVPGEVILVQTTPCSNANISSQPQSLTRCEGSSASFTVVYGAAPASTTTTVQWQVYGGNATWTNISNGGVYSGATTNTLSISSVTGLNGFGYRAIVTNTSTDPNVPVDRRVCSVNSNSATLTVDPATVAGTATTTTPICSGSSSTVTLSGYTGTIVKWQYTTNASWIDVPSSAGVSSLGTGTLTQTTKYRAVVQSGVCGALNSNEATVVVDPPTNAGTAAVSLSPICSGSTSTVTLTGYTGSIVKWQYTTNASWIDVPSSAGVSSLGTGTLTQTTKYRAVVQSGVCGALNSNEATVVVDPPTNAGTAAVSLSPICSGSTSTVTLTGYTGSIVKWQYTTNASWIDVPSSAGVSSLGTGTLTQTTKYRAVVQSGVCAALNSNEVTVVVDPPTNAGTAAASQSPLCYGATTTITLSGYTGIIEKWQSSTGGGIWNDIASTSSSISSGVLTQTTQFRAVVKSGVCNAQNSTPTTVVVNNLPTAAVSATPDPQCYSAGGNTFILNGQIEYGTASWTVYSKPSDFAVSITNGTSAVASATVTGSEIGGSVTFLLTTISNTSCGSATATVIVTINAQAGAPSVTYLPPACDEATFSVRVNDPIDNGVYIIKDKNGNDINGVKVGAATLSGGVYTATGSDAFNFTNIPAGSGYRITVTQGECTSASQNCGEPSGAPARYSGNTTDKVHINFPAKEPSVLAYPNPYNDKIRFVVTAPESGQGSLDLFNVLGQKVRTVYQGNIIQGTQTFEVSIPQQQRSTLIYRMILNGRQASGKLINANQ